MQQTKTEPIIYETNAKQITITGWACKTCNRFHGNDGSAEHMAKWCCATDLPCNDCETGRAEKHYTRCRGCRDLHEEKRYLALPEVEWDGETPLVGFSDDSYFFNPEDVDCHLADGDGDCSYAERIAGLRLVLCTRVYPRYFELTDHVTDELPDDMDFDTSEIDKTVNEYLKANFPEVWTAGKVRVSVSSVLAAIGGEPDRAAESEVA